MDAWGSATVIAMLALLIHDAITPHTLLLLAAVTVGYWGAFAVNDFFDAPADAADPAKGRRNFFVRRPTSLAELLILIFPVGAFAGAVLLSFGWRGVGFLLLGLVIVWGYSAPPLRFKLRPGLDLLTHALFVETQPYLVCLVLTGVAWTALDGVMLAILFLASLAAQLEQQVRDFAVDAQSEGRTVVLLLGKRRATLLLRAVTGALILLALVAIAAGLVPPFLLIFGVIAAPALLHRFLRRQDTPRSERLVFASIAAAMLYTGVLFAHALFGS